MASPGLDTRRAKSPSGSERRIANRNKSYAESWVDPGGILPAIICKIIDISYTGAKLMFNPGVVVPDTFVLHTGASKRSANVVWRSKSEVGVEFELRRRTDLPGSTDEPSLPKGMPERRQGTANRVIKS